MTMVSTRLLLAASLCLAPLGWAAAQDQQQHDDRYQRDHQEHHQQQQRPQQQQPEHNQQQQHNRQPQQGNTAPQGPHVGGPGAGGHGGGQQFQRPAQNTATPPNTQSFQRPAPINVAPPSPPAGATASPTPPSQSQFRRAQGQPQNLGGAPTSPTQQQQQQFQQRSVQRGSAAGSAAPQAQTQAQPQQQQQQTTNSRVNFQGNTRSANTAAFTQHHGGAAPTAFNHGHFYGHDYVHFTVHERDLWHRGAWHHEFHSGRYGWWYAVDGIWYFYAEPIYPYPTYIPDVVYLPEEEDEVPPPVYADAAPPEPVPPEPAPPAQYGQQPIYYYYFCPDAQTYYPYVTSCASPWQPVPTTPPQ